MKKATISVLQYGVLTLYSLFIILPIVWLGLTSVKTNKELYVPSLPTEITFEKYKEVIRDYDLVHYFSNSLIIAATTTLVVSVVAALAATV